MKTYKVYLKQLGEGCDYTIGCGKTIETIEAENIKDAIIRLKEIIADNYNHDESRLEKVEIYETSTIENFDIKSFYDDLNKMEELANISKKQEFERLEYERLKAKFGGN
jgi:hypothetical protein